MLSIAFEYLMPKPCRPGVFAGIAEGQAQPSEENFGVEIFLLLIAQGERET
jgi:hypothetical protein